MMSSGRVAAVTALFAFAFAWPADALVSCNSTVTCEAVLGPRSECNEDGFCSNPFHRGGCLENLMPEERLRLRRSFLRACNSEDPPEAEEMGFCRVSELDYTEVRISSQNWESAFFSAWIMQILLSELVQVPATIETGTPTALLNFYDDNMPMDYGKANDLESLRTSRQYGDCRRAKADTAEGEYKSCAHVVPELWFGERDEMMRYHLEGIVDTPVALGALGQEGWYIPRHVAVKDPSLLTYLGLQGRSGRHKLAATFRRPTSWEDYCLYVSHDRCATPDNVAKRAPQKSTEEETMYYMENAYTGHFRNTTQNDCQKWPDNCTGHIVDYPCGWSSFVKQQSFHLGIGVESNGPEPGGGGYSYAQMTQILSAANHTRDNLLMLWWTPEAFTQTYFGTDMEFQKISLPPPTQECVDHRVDPIDRCEANHSVQVGDPRGACGQPPQVLVKVLGNSLFDLSFDSNLPSALHSPAYDLVKNFQITDLQYSDIFKLWLDRGVDRWNYDPRWAVCQWIVDNLDDTLEAFVPRTFPRTLQSEAPLLQNPLHLASLLAAGLALILTCLTGLVTHLGRQREAVRYAQIEFLWLLLAGLLLVSLAAFLTALPPSDHICVSLIWLSNFGYTLELVPLVLKIGAIHQIYIAAQQMRRITLRKQALFGGVLGISVLVGVTLAVWTAIDPPHQNVEVRFAGGGGGGGTTHTASFSHGGGDEQSIIEQSSYCGQDKEFWDLLGVSWQAFLLFCASILAFQTRKIRKDLNEARTLAMLIYSHFVLALMRSLTYVVDLSRSDLAGARSLIYTTDVIATIFIYFLPKFLAPPTTSARRSGGSGGLEQPSSSLFARNVARQVGQVLVDDHNMARGGTEVRETEEEDDDKEVFDEEDVVEDDNDDILGPPVSLTPRPPPEQPPRQPPLPDRRQEFQQQQQHRYHGYSRRSTATI